MIPSIPPCSWKNLDGDILGDVTLPGLFFIRGLVRLPLFENLLVDNSELGDTNEGGTGALPEYLETI